MSEDAAKKREYHTRMDKRMFDFEAFYQRIAGELPDKAVIAEIGVADGASAIFLAEALLNQGKTFTMHLVDNLAYGGASQLVTLVNHLARADVAERIEIIPMDSLSASCRFAEVHFDFVFIDASHKFEETKADIRLWSWKVKEGGILAGHDYNEKDGIGVKQAVDIVIPRFVIRDPFPNKQFEPEPVLRVEDTSAGCGVWWYRKMFYVKLN